MPRMKLPKKLLPLVQKKKRFKVIIGGRGSGKSHSVADICLMDAQTKGIKTGCFREFMNSIEDSVYSLLCGEIERLELQGFDTQNNKIKFNDKSMFTFKGLARNPESVKSMHGYERFVIEEAQTISKKSLELLTPTLRTDDSEIWFIANPQSQEDPLSKRFINPFKSELDKHGYYEDDQHLIIVCNYIDNPFFPIVLEKERLADFERLERAEYDHIWLGAFNDTVENAIIKKEWFDAAIDSHITLGFKPVGATIATFDPSDEGGDAKGYAVRTGVLYTNVDEIEAKNGNEACDIATSYAIADNADLFVWDADGMGALLRRQIGDSFKGIKCDLRAYRGSNAVEDKDRPYEGLSSLGNKDKPKTNGETFNNKRSQFYMKLAQRFYNTYLAVVKKQYIDPDTIISLSSDIKLIDKLRSEVCRIPRKPNGAGKIQLMSKPEMKSKHGIESPNMADCLAMGEELPEIIQKKVKLRFDTIC
jgi:phage terminase large subunit